MSDRFANWKPPEIEDGRLTKYHWLVQNKAGLKLGHRTVHHLAGPTDSEPALMRRGSWQRTLESAGVRAPEPWIGDWTPRSGYEIGKRIAGPTPHWKLLPLSRLPSPRL